MTVNHDTASQCGDMDASQLAAIAGDITKRLSERVLAADITMPGDKFTATHMVNRDLWLHVDYVDRLPKYIEFEEDGELLFRLCIEAGGLRDEHEVPKAESTARLIKHMADVKTWLAGDDTALLWQEPVTH